MKSLFHVVVLVLALRAADSRLIDRKAVKELFDDEVRDVLEADTSFDDKGQGKSEGEGNGEDKNCHCQNTRCPRMVVVGHLSNESKDLEHAKEPIDCRKGSRVLNDENEKFLCENLYDCCRSCNARFFHCLKERGAPNKLGAAEQCLREAYTCMCNCLEKNPFPKIKDVP